MNVLNLRLVIHSFLTGRYQISLVRNGILQFLQAGKLRHKNIETVYQQSSEGVKEAKPCELQLSAIHYLPVECC